MLDVKSITREHNRFYVLLNNFCRKCLQDNVTGKKVYGFCNCFEKCVIEKNTDLIQNYSRKNSFFSDRKVERCRS